MVSVSHDKKYRLGQNFFFLILEIQLRSVFMFLLFDRCPVYVLHLLPVSVCIFRTQRAVLVGGRVGKTTLRHMFAKTSKRAEAPAACISGADPYSVREMDMGEEVKMQKYVRTYDTLDSAFRTRAT